MQESSSNKPLIIGTIVVAALVFAGLVWAIMSAPSGPTSGGSENVTFNDEGAKFKGKADSKVVVHVYSDFQCPACLVYEPVLKYAMDKYGDRVKFVWKDFPLMSIHANARNAANAAWCADDQGKFWEYHDLLYSEQGAWSALPNPADSFRAYANRLGLDQGSFGTCYEAKSFDSKVMAGVQEGNANRVNGTPTVFVNDVRQMGLDKAGWDRVLTAALATP